MSVKITDNSQKVLSEFQQKLALGATAIGLTAEAYAKKDCPVDTGRLQNSISHDVNIDEKKIYIGTNVEYAKYVEFMDNYGKNPRETGKPHFLRDAAATHSEEYKSMMQSALKK